MSEPIGFLYYYIIIGFFMFIWVSGCSHEHPLREDIYISNIDRTINEFSSESKDVCKYRVFSGQKESSDLSTKYNSNNKSYYRRYDCANQGSYSSCCYVVKPGDTLFYIAWITGNNYHVLAERNNINVHDVLKVGQILQVGSDKQQLSNRFFKKYKYNHHQNCNLHKKRNVSSCVNVYKLGNCSDNNTDENINNKTHYMLNKKFVNLLSSSNQNISSSNSANVVSDNKKKEVELSVINNKSRVIWMWPAYGKIVSGFSAFDGGNKGIDISGVLGQSIFSAASGKVVYVGNALVGYGNLIIIKHNDDFLSTYSHNETLLVSEQQYVKGGQKIATMGSSESDIIKLYFEIRYKGKSVDPLYYLPKR